MNTATIKFEAFEGLQNDECQKRILDAKKKLGKKIIILGHHYQNESVYKHADLTGDSLKLAKYVSNLEAKYIIFLGGPPPQIIKTAANLQIPSKNFQHLHKQNLQ